MNMKNLSRMSRSAFSLLLSALLLGPLAASAQESGFSCRAHDLSLMGPLVNNDPVRLQEIQTAADNLEHFTQAWQADAARGGGTNYIIPVVFHIIHENGPENISDLQVYDAIRVMNEDYNKMTPDWQDVQPEFLSSVGDIGITFKLAQLDPDGNCTNGITRTVSSLTNSGNQQMKNLIDWPRNRYLNIWVAASAGGAAGYSMYPSDVSGSWGAAADGIVILSSYVGAIGTSSLNNSHSLSHEAGHWLNLKHCWGDSNDPGVTSNCSTDDNVSDTPNTIGWTSCNLRGASCGSALDNVENFMEYSYCSKMFTDGQKNRVLAALNSSTASRNNLWTTSNLALTGVSLDPVICAVQFNSTERVICAGESVTFTDASFNGVTERDWTFEGGTPATSDAVTPVVTYDTPGLFNVSLTVGNGSQSQSTTEQQYVRVLPYAGMALPFVEGFEAVTTLPSNDWTVNDSELDGTFQVSSAAAFTGSKSVRLQNSSSTTGNKDELISTTIDITTAPPVVFSFRYAYAKRSSANNDVLRVYASRDCGDTWSLRRTLSGDALVTAPITTGSFTPNGPGQWGYNETSPIGSLFIVSNLRFKFLFESDGGNNLWIDDINITGSTTAVSELAGDASNTLTVVPNPAHDRSVITAHLKDAGPVKVELVDLLGRPVRTIAEGTRPAGTAQWTMDLSGLSGGMYFVRLQQHDAVRVAKFTKE
ncbi:MAG TPA: M43 family zinc metalloprotease [Flavobacteriales bacterium]|jgi:PKD repeat protein|nr:MAG: T9SS type A sorting domain-containing protein [Flavobacteriales bacterium]HQV37666.1 M43 family zinc metalloprotease [Flavobacteriales bacterium]HQY78939.1 M43 family zinc metalloprotease [Flavobacteriales bacterium]HRA15533.1 M43 family zinc metalloprotease [Flavobacteriales bacterium]